MAFHRKHIIDCESNNSLRYLIAKGSGEESNLLRGLVGILISYSYDVRTTQAQTTCESAWTVSTLSPLLSWLDDSLDLDQVLVDCVRRILAFPYMRNFELALLCLWDASTIFRRGKRCILRCLLQIRNIFATSDVYYLLNRLFIDDYCTWIQCTSIDTLESFSQALEAAVIRFECNGKSQTKWGLAQLEADAVALRDSESESVSLQEQ